ncbi:MAG: tRNA (5-methylaminomethyl-2-thiouridine)(34)-methyltransferase MnmD [Phycisphaeraceae bacterium]
MPDEAPYFDDRGRLIAPKYDDVYFSAEDGLAETRHVFLQGNQLAKRFSGLAPGDVFTIGETGFGTGLNFLAAWQLFKQHAPADARLEFVSVEGLPLGAETMRRALLAWPALQRYRDALLTQWGPIWPGTHRFRFASGRVRLTLLVGEAADVLSSINASVNAWFLDGFAPSRNPAMWSDAVFAEVARLSAGAATLATYTAAGFVRRGLGAVGFEIEKRPGFGTKRDMTAGRRSDVESGGACSARPSARGQSAVVVGGSLAGSLAARSLAERGVAVTVIEQQPSTSNSMFPPALIPRTAVLQPKISDRSDRVGRFLREGYAFAWRLVTSDAGLRSQSRWSEIGTFQAAYDERAHRSLRRFVDQFGDTKLCRWIDSAQTASEIGLQLGCSGVVIDRAGTLNPAGLCAALLDHGAIEVMSNARIESIERRQNGWRVIRSGKGIDDTPLLVIANALDACRLLPDRDIDLRPVRGQVSCLSSPEAYGDLAPLRRAVFFGGYIIPSHAGTLSIGASFVPGDASIQWRDREHVDCCDKLARLMPDQAGRLKSLAGVDGWVGVRTTTPKHRCYAEQIEDRLYVSLGHGSHGIASAAHAGEHLASLITGGVRARETR